MSLNPAPREASLFGPADRRANNRYPVAMELAYRLPIGGQAGAGRSVDISSGGVCFSASESLNPGTVLEVILDWPVRLEGVLPLQVVATGSVIWSHQGRTAVKFRRYEFKTRRQARNTAQERSGDIVRVA